MLVRQRVAHPLRPLLTMLLALLCMAGCNTSANAQGPTVTRAAGSSTQPGGVATVSAMNGFSASHLPQPQLDQQLAAMQTNGVQLVRSDAPWAEIEPVAPGPAGPVWQFGHADAWVTALATHDLTWEPIIDYSVGWAKTCPGFCPPTSDATYATFARAVAARYGEHGSFWAEHPELPYHPAQIFEIWNEENTTQFWSTGPDAARYAKLYVAARQAIRTADPAARVIVGGLGAPGSTFNPAQDYPAQFVQQMFAADPGLRGSVDGFGLHPYAPTPPDVAQWVIHFRTVLDSLGEASAPIDLTEFGWPTGDPITETARATMMRDLAFNFAHSNCGLRMLAPYDWINPAFMNEPNDFGFVDRSATNTVLRPAGIAWFSELKLAGSLPEMTLCPTAHSTPAAGQPPRPVKPTRAAATPTHHRRHHAHRARRGHHHRRVRRHRPSGSRRHA